MMWYQLSMCFAGVELEVVMRFHTRFWAGGFEMVVCSLNLLCGWKTYFALSGAARSVVFPPRAVIWL